MLWLPVLLIFILIILFIPIPIKLSLKYINNTLQIYVYKIPINLRKNISKIKEKSHKDNNKKTNIKFTHLLTLIKKLNKNKFKPTLNLNIELIYGLSEPSNTGIFYGLIYSISPFLQKFFDIFFKTKEYNLYINPNFDNSIINLQINSIISVSLVKIIYILFITLRCLKKGW